MTVTSFRSHGALHGKETLWLGAGLGKGNSELGCFHGGSFCGATGPSRLPGGDIVMEKIKEGGGTAPVAGCVVSQSLQKKAISVCSSKEKKRVTRWSSKEPGSSRGNSLCKGPEAGLGLARRQVGWSRVSWGGEHQGRWLTWGPRPGLHEMRAPGRITRR